MKTTRAIRRKPAVTATFRKTELDWMETNLDKFEPYRGQWVVIEGEGIIAAAPDYADARASAVKQGVDRPLIFRIPENDTPSMGV